MLAQQTPLTEIEFTAFDLETTGLDPWSCRIVEFGAVRFRLLGGEEEVFEQLVDPQCPIPRAAQRVHGITAEMVRGQPTLAEALPQFFAFAARPGAVLLAHHARFDLGFLAAAASALQTAPPPCPVVDTLGLARSLLRYGSSYALKPLAMRLGLPLGAQHRALADARLAARVFAALLRRVLAVRTWGDLLRLSPPLRLAASSSAGSPRPCRLRNGPPGRGIPAGGMLAHAARAAENPALMDAQQEATIRLAIRSRRVLLIVYDGGTKGQSRRRITPRALVRWGGRPVLAAWCHLDGVEKHFRLDRIRSLELER